MWTILALEIALAMHISIHLVNGEEVVLDFTQWLFLKRVKKQF